MTQLIAIIEARGRCAAEIEVRVINRQRGKCVCEVGKDCSVINFETDKHEVELKYFVAIIGEVGRCMVRA